jgi:hypothetical protein
LDPLQPSPLKENRAASGPVIDAFPSAVLVPELLTWKLLNCEPKKYGWAL